MDKIGIFVRVSTQDQDAKRQLEDIREYVATEYPDAETEEFVDIITGRCNWLSGRQTVLVYSC